MAFFKPNILFGDITGVLGKIDRTINRDSGLSCRLVKRGGKLSYEIKTAGTRGGSAARHARAALYVKCDCKWKRLTPFCKDLIEFNKIHNGSAYEKTLSTYHYFMRYCLYSNDCYLFSTLYCYSVYIYMIWVGDIMDITGKATSPICDLKGDLYVNGILKKTKQTDDQGAVSFTLSKYEV